MAATTNFYKYASAMQAAYADLSDSSLIESALQDVGKGDFTLTQAIKFLEEFSAIEGGHHANDSSGFSATLFRENSSEGQAIIAIRGTEQVFADIFDADISQIGGLGIALDQAISLYNYVSELGSGVRRQVALTSVETLSGISPVGVDVLYSVPQGQGVF
jgi:hypothetical protein